MMIVAMRVAFDVHIAGHDEKAVFDAHDFDRRSVEARQHRPVHHVVDGSDHRLASAEIEDAIDRVDEGIRARAR